MTIGATTYTPLHTEELAGEEIRLELGEVAKTWRDLAKTLYTQTTDIKKKSMYERAVSVNAFTRLRTKKPSNFDYRFSVVICYGLDLKIQGFALTTLTQLPLIVYKKRQPKLEADPEKTFVRLIYLSVNPEGLSQGVGTRLIQFLFDKCKNESFAGVFVEPVPEATSFFDGKGFAPAENTGSEAPHPMLWRPLKPSSQLA